MGYRMTEGPRWDDFDEALAAIRDIGPGGHYLGHPHTLENFERAFFMPQLFDNNSIEQWKAEGSQEITERALEHAKNCYETTRNPNWTRPKTRNCWTTSPGANGKSRRIRA
jgi:trimethylamine--corrinoid protein Co-methyltransferase